MRLDPLRSPGRSATAMDHGFLIVLLTVFFAFLGILAVLSLAVTKTVNSHGQTGRGVFGGLASALALIFLTGMGAVGTGAFVVAAFVGTAIDKNPIERIEVRRGAPAPDDGSLTAATPEPSLDPTPDRAGARRKSFHTGDHGPVHVLFTVRGGAGRELIDLLRDVVEVESAELERLLTVHEETTTDGTPYEIFEVPPAHRGRDRRPRARHRTRARRPARPPAEAVAIPVRRGATVLLGSFSARAGSARLWGWSHPRSPERA